MEMAATNVAGGSHAFHRCRANTVSVGIFPLLLVVIGTLTAVHAAEDDLRALVESLVLKNQRLEATIADLRVELLSKHKNLAMSTARDRQRQVEWRRDVGQQLEGLKRYAGAEGATRRSLSTDSCVDPAAPLLSVDGLCSCADGLLVNGRNVTAELDELKAACAANAGETTTSRNTRNCTILDESILVGSTPGNSVNMNTPRGVAVSADGRHAYVVSVNSDSLAIVDVATDPANPVVVGSIAGDDVTMEYPNDVATSLDGKYVYVIGRESGTLAVVDVATDVTEPVVVGSVHSLSAPVGIAVSPDGQYAYVTGYYSNRFDVVDVMTDPQNPAIVGNLTGGALAAPGNVGMSLDGAYAFVPMTASDGFAVINVSDPTTPMVVGGISGDSVRMNYCSHLVVSPCGQYVYASAYYSNGFVVIDVTNVTGPVVVASITNNAYMQGAYGVNISPDGQTLFVAGWASNSVAVVNTSDPLNPVVVGSANGAHGMSTPYEVGLSPNGTFAFVTAAGADSLAVIQWQECVDNA